MIVLNILKDVNAMLLTLAIANDFTKAVQETEEGEGQSSSDSSSPSYWKLKKTRNGFKGRTFKHPENIKKKKARPDPIPSAC